LDESERIGQARLRVDEAAPTGRAGPQEHRERGRAHGGHGQHGHQEAGGHALTGGERRPQGDEGDPELTEHDATPEEEADEDGAGHEQEAEDHRGLARPVDDDQGGHRAGPVDAEEPARIRTDAPDRQEHEPEGERDDGDARRHQRTPTGRRSEVTDHGEADDPGAEQDPQHGQWAQELEGTAERHPRADAGEPSGADIGVEAARARGAGGRRLQIIPAAPGRRRVDTHGHPPASAGSPST